MTQPCPAVSVRFTLAVAYGTTAVAVTAVSLLAPNLPELAIMYDVDVAATAWIQSGVVVPGVLSATVLMRHAGRVGLPRVLVGSLTCYGLAGVANTVHDVFWLAVSLRVIQGIGGGFLVAASFALLNRLGGPHRATRITRNCALISLLMVLGPLIGGALGQLSPRAPYGYYFIGLLLAAWVARNGSQLPTTAPRADGNTSEVARPRVVGGALAMTAITNLLLFGWLLYLGPIFLSEVLGLSVAGRGLVLSLQSVAGVIAALASGRLLLHNWEPRLLAASAVCISIAFLVVAAGTDVPTVVPGLLLAGTAYGLSNPSLVSLITNDRGDAGSAWWQSAARLGQVIGPLLGAAALAPMGPAAAMRMGALAGPMGLAAVAAIASSMRIASNEEVPG